MPAKALDQGETYTVHDKPYETDDENRDREIGIHQILAGVLDRIA